MERKPYTFISEKEVSKESINEIVINELINLDYSEYYDFVSNYITTANIRASANLRLTFQIESTNKHNDISEEIKTSNNMIIDIQLDEPTMQISTNYIAITQSPNIEIQSNQTNTNQIFKILSVSSGVLAFILMTAVILNTIEKNKSIPLYERFVRELKNNFDYDISELSNLIDTENEDNYEYFNVVSFKELYDYIKTSTDKKILWNEKEYYNDSGELINRISWFFIFMSDTKVMRFIVDENKLVEEYAKNLNILKKYRG